MKMDIFKSKLSRISTTASDDTSNCTRRKFKTPRQGNLTSYGRVPKESTLSRSKLKQSTFYVSSPRTRIFGGSIHNLVWNMISLRSLSLFFVIFLCFNYYAIGNPLLCEVDQRKEQKNPSRPISIVSLTSKWVSSPKSNFGHGLNNKTSLRSFVSTIFQWTPSTNRLRGSIKDIPLLSNTIFCENNFEKLYNARKFFQDEVSSVILNGMKDENNKADVNDAYDDEKDYQKFNDKYFENDFYNEKDSSYTDAPNFNPYLRSDHQRFGNEDYKGLRRNPGDPRTRRTGRRSFISPSSKSETKLSRALKRLKFRLIRKLRKEAPLMILGVLLVSLSSVWFFSPPGSIFELRTTESIPFSSYKNNQVLHGRVIKVSDGDTIRVRHIPTYFSIIKEGKIKNYDVGEISSRKSSVQAPYTNKKGKDNNKAKKPRLSDETIIVRVAGVDSPEMSGSMTDIANKGNVDSNPMLNPSSSQGGNTVQGINNGGTRTNGNVYTKGQPFAVEARNFVRKELLNQKVTLKLLRKDQYSRAVCSVKYGPWYSKKDLAEELLKNGYAVVYREGGAEYDGKKAYFETLEENAKRKKVGIWSQKGYIEKPSDYKQLKNNGGKIKTQAFFGQKTRNK